MQKKYLLPELKEQKVVNTNECWENLEQIYDFLLENLKLHYEPKSSIFDGGSNAYPHIFEQMLLFHDAFLHNDDPEHKRAILEWRACLAIMALQRIKNVKLDMIKVDFQNNKNVFLQAAASFLPEDSPVFFHTTWDYLYVLCMDNEPIAILSPITLVCPAKQFYKKIAGLRWIDLQKQNGEEQLNFDFKGRGNEYSNLKNWLKKLNLKKFSDKKEVINNFELVCRELENYIEWVEKESSTDVGIGIETADHIYYSMNVNSRGDYDFFNFCCDFHLKNPDLEFLKQRYHSDIFQNKLLVVVYDKDPDAMYQVENLDKMDALFQQIPKIEGRRVIAVQEPGGGRLPVYVFLPFRDSFVEELIRYRICPEEMLEECKIEFIRSQDIMEVTIQIWGFPYTFEKRYVRQEWQFMYGTELVDAYIWPDCQINDDSWKAYYTLFFGIKDIKMSILESVSSQIKSYDTEHSKEIYVVKTERFPTYIRYEYQGISGYLPIRTRNKKLNQTGGTAVVFVHVGHSMTYVEIMGKNKEGKDADHLFFEKPKSKRIVGDANHWEDICGYFVSPESVVESGKRKRYFKNMLHSFWKNKSNDQSIEIRPMQDGQVLFDMFGLDKDARKEMITFFNFDYDLMYEEARRNVHLFLEEILLYAAHAAINFGYTYMRVEYLYCVEDKDEKLGQLGGLWENAFWWVKKWTGIKGDIRKAIGRMDEPQSLAYLLYRHLYPNNLIDLNDDLKTLYVGVDIGWEKTLVCLLSGEKKEEESIPMLLKGRWAQIDFAGRHISMLDGDIQLESYPEMLSILLRGSDIIGKNGIDNKLLHEFGSLFTSASCDKKYFLGLFDVIAMRIEDAGFKIPSDVYNKKQQFKAFLEVMTYNIFLLFLNIGYIINEMRVDKNKDIDSIHLYLSGNGAKFLKWVSNVKSVDNITEENSKEFFICKTIKSLPEVVKMGFKIKSIKTKIGFCEIEMFGEEEQLIDGHIFKEFPQNSGIVTLPEIPLVEIKNNTVSECEAHAFFQEMMEVRNSFEDAFFQDGTQKSNISKNINTTVEVIKNESESMGKKLAEAIRKMGSN